MISHRYYYIPYDVRLIHEEDLEIYPYRKVRVLAFIWKNVPIKCAVNETFLKFRIIVTGLDKVRL